MMAEPTLEAFWELESNKSDEHAGLINSTEIAKQARKSPSYKGQVSQVLNRLSVDGKEPSKKTTRTFENEEIVYYDGGEWKLTGYGRLLLYHVFEKSGDPTWIQATAIGKPLPMDEGPRYTEKDSRILEEGVNHYYDD